MTRSTSEVAVCCSSASLSSRERCSGIEQPTFSIAITAWSAKVVTSSICLSVNGRTCLRHKMIRPMGVSRRSGTPSSDRI